MKGHPRWTVDIQKVCRGCDGVVHLEVTDRGHEEWKADSYFLAGRIHSDGYLLATGIYRRGQLFTVTCDAAIVADIKSESVCKHILS